MNVVVALYVGKFESARFVTCRVIWENEEKGKPDFVAQSFSSYRMFHSRKFSSGELCGFDNDTVPILRCMLQQGSAGTAEQNGLRNQKGRVLV